MLQQFVQKWVLRVRFRPLLRQSPYRLRTQSRQFWLVLYVGLHHYDHFGVLRPVHLPYT